MRNRAPPILLVTMRLLQFALVVAAAAETVYTPVDSTQYTYLGTGGCRGNGGPTDKVNGREADGLTQAECEAACNSEATCVGYSHKVGGSCVIYGPGLHGICPDTTKKLQSHCGTCSVVSAIDSVGCTNAGGTWTDGGWDGPELPFTGEGHATTHIHAAHTPASGVDMEYPCFDHNDFLADGLAKCTGMASASSGSSGQDCKTVFDAADDYLIASCPGAEADAAALEADANYVVGCTWTAAPAFKPKPPHAPDMKFPGWNAATPGACRSSCGPGGPPNYAATCDTEKQVRPGNKWCKTCGANPAGQRRYVKTTAGQCGPKAADWPRAGRSSRQPGARSDAESSRARAPGCLESQCFLRRDDAVRVHDGVRGRAELREHHTPARTDYPHSRTHGHTHARHPDGIRTPPRRPELLSRVAQVGYHHGPWCGVFGPGPELWNMSHPSFGTNIPAGQSNAWGGNSFPDDTGDIVHALDTTKANIEYICLTPCGEPTLLPRVPRV